MEILRVEDNFARIKIFYSQVVCIGCLVVDYGPFQSFKEESTHKYPGIMTAMSGAYEYQVVTLFECMQNPATLSWLEQFKLPLPDQIPPGRYPSPLEIRGVMESLSSVKTDYLVGKSSWQVTITNRKDIGWATLAIKDYSGEIDVPHPFYFVGGWDELILLVTTRLAKICGPLVLLHESGAAPQIVR